MDMHSSEASDTGTESQERFPVLSQNDLQSLLEGKDSKSTKHATQHAVKTFRDYLCSSGKSADFENYELSELDIQLKNFYASARKNDGTPYKKTALTGIRYGLNRHLNTNGIDILRDCAFNDSNMMFKAVMVDLKRQGFGKINHHPEIKTDDIRKLYSHEVCFNTSTPQGLLNKVWFEIMLFSCRKGRENLREMTKTTFGVGIDSSGKEFVYQMSDGLVKNNQGNDQQPTDNRGEGRMYALPGNPNCPVLSFKKYMSKLNPANNALWQRPLDTYNEYDHVWYGTSVLGKNSLGNMMKKLSVQAHLSRTYTNHSIRSTSITILNEVGFWGHLIEKVSGHKNGLPLNSYFNRDGKRMYREMSEIVGNASGQSSSGDPDSDEESNDHQLQCSDLENSLGQRRKSSGCWTKVASTINQEILDTAKEGQLSNRPSMVQVQSAIQCTPSVNTQNNIPPFLRPVNNYGDGNTVLVNNIGKPVKVLVLGGSTIKPINPRPVMCYKNKAGPVQKHQEICPKKPRLEETHSPQSLKHTKDNSPALVSANHSELSNFEEMLNRCKILPQNGVDPESVWESESSKYHRDRDYLNTCDDFEDNIDVKPNVEELNSCIESANKMDEKDHDDNIDTESIQKNGHDSSLQTSASSRTTNTAFTSGIDDDDHLLDYIQKVLKDRKQKTEELAITKQKLKRAQDEKAVEECKLQSLRKNVSKLLKTFMPDVAHVSEQDLEGVDKAVVSLLNNF